MSTQYFNVDKEMAWYRMPHIDRYANHDAFKPIDRVNNPREERLATAFLKEVRAYKPVKKIVEVKVVDKPLVIQQPANLNTFITECIYDFMHGAMSFTECIAEVKILTGV